MPPDRLASTLSLRYCTGCPRTDRWTPLKARHYSSGKLCKGEVKVAVYSFNYVAPPRKDAD